MVSQAIPLSETLPNVDLPAFFQMVSESIDNESCTYVLLLIAKRLELLVNRAIAIGDERLLEELKALNLIVEVVDDNT